MKATQGLTKRMFSVSGQGILFSLVKVRKCVTPGIKWLLLQHEKGCHTPIS